MARWECCTPQGLVSTAELEPTAGQVVSRPNNDTILALDRRSGRFLQVRTTRTRHHRTASGKRPTGQDYVLCKPWVSPAGCAPSPTAVESGRGFPQVQMPRAEDDGTRWLAPGCIAGTLGAGEPRRVGAVDQTSPSFNLGSSPSCRRRTPSAATGSTSTAALAPRTRSPIMLDQPADERVMSRDQRPASTPAASPHIRSGNMHPRAVEHV